MYKYNNSLLRVGVCSNTQFPFFSLVKIWFVEYLVAGEEMYGFVDFFIHHLNAQNIERRMSNVLLPEFQKSDLNL